VEQVRAVPVVGVTTADAGQVRTGTLGTPQERVVPDALAGDGVVAVALGFGTERTDHLRVADVAAFADVDVATFQLQGGVGFHASTGSLTTSWKNSGTIWVRPPMTTAMTMKMDSRPTFFSRISCFISGLLEPCTSRPLPFPQAWRC